MSVATIGEVVVDWLSVKAGKSRLDATQFSRHLGGNAANVAIAFSRLGGAARLIGRIGVDFHGDFLKRILIREGVLLDFLIADDKHPTAQCYVFTDANGGHSFYNWPDPNAASDLKPRDVKAEALAGARFLHATGISMTAEPRRSAIEKAISLASQFGMIISFDAGFPTGEDEAAKVLAAGCLARAHIVKVNLQELMFWSDAESLESPKEMAQVLFERYRPTVLAATLAGNGCILVSDKGTAVCPGYEVYSVDEVGAGDAFMAGLMYAVDQRLGQASNPEKLAELSISDWQRIGAFANAVGARACERLGATEGLPVLDEVLALLALPANKVVI